MLRPICPICRREGRSSPLAIGVVEAETHGDISSGILLCQSCSAEYPILDGMPVLVPDVRRYIRDNLFYLMARTDLTETVESLLGDAAGPGSGLDSLRQHVSSYVWDHWGDHDPEEVSPAAGGAVPGSVARAVHCGLEMLSERMTEGPILDVGCGAGRSAAELAAATGRTVLGIDISVPLARAGRMALVEGRIDYSRRRIGLVYDRRRFALPAAKRDLVDVWICDAQALPFAPDTFALVAGMNVLDCLEDPRNGLIEIDRVLKSEGEALISVPFDWTSQATPVEAWLGGHSQRSPHAGRAEAILDMLLSDGPLAAGSLRRVQPPRETAWHVRLHDRSCMHYQAHLVAARRITHQAGAEPDREG